jgi:hypothetical protein
MIKALHNWTEGMKGERLHATDTLLREMLARVVETLNETVADAVGSALEAVKLGKVKPGTAQGVLDVLNNVGLKRFLVTTEVPAHVVTMFHRGVFF